MGIKREVADNLITLAKKVKKNIPNGWVNPLMLEYEG